MESEIALTSIFILMLVVTATAKSALDELSDVSLRVLASDSEDTPHAQFWRAILEHYHRLSFTLTFGIHISIASIAILISSIANQIYPQHFLAAAFGGMILTVVIFRQVLPLIATQNDPQRTLLKLRVPLRILWPLLGAIAHPLHRTLRALQREPEPPAQTQQETASNNSDARGESVAWRATPQRGFCRSKVNQARRIAHAPDYLKKPSDRTALRQTSLFHQGSTTAPS